VVFITYCRGLQLGSPISLSEFGEAETVSELPTAPLNQISVIRHEGELAYRLSIAPPPKTWGASKSKDGEHAHHDKSDDKDVSDANVRNARFDGQATEQGSLFYSVETGQKVATNDRDVALLIASEQIGVDLLIASEQIGVDPSALIDATLIKRFGLHYDFRNKRLPIWQLTFDSELGDMVFIDPATGILVDRLVDTDRYEGYSFSFLHKWNFLTPFIGREVRDIVMAIMLLLIMLFVGLGVTMKMRHR